MGESEPRVNSVVAEELKRNLLREEGIKKETGKINKIVDMILKSPKPKSEKKAVDNKDKAIKVK